MLRTTTQQYKPTNIADSEVALDMALSLPRFYCLPIKGCYWCFFLDKKSNQKSQGFIGIVIGGRGNMSLKDINLHAKRVVY